MVSSDDLSRKSSHGPAIVDEQTATTVVPPGWTLRVDELGNLLVTNGEDA